MSALLLPGMRLIWNHFLPWLLFAIRLILEAGAEPTGTPQLFDGRWYQDDDLDFKPRTRNQFMK